MNNEIKFKKNMNCLNKWMSSRENGKWIADYLNRYNIHKVAIYGYGILGRHLFWELRKRNYYVAWVMDRTSFGDEQYNNIVRPDCIESLDEADMVVITSLSAVEEVEMFIRNYMISPIISIEELVESMYAWRD